MRPLASLFLPFLDWIQVEVTSHCNAECGYCPHSVYKQSWQDIHIPIETFEKLLPAFRRTRLVYLQGWGEPVLHPRFFEMVRIARECGCQVGTTTNGMLCTGPMADRMVREGLSIVGFSLAGTDESQDTIRRGTRLQAALQAINRLSEAKKKLGSSLPDIHVAYIWLRSRLEAVKQLPALLEGTGVSQVVVSTLDFVPHPDLAVEALCAQDEDEESFLRGIISEVIKDGRKRGLDIQCRLVTRYRPPGICTENVTRALFVSSLGLVSPCVFRNLPIIENQGRGELDSCAPTSLIFGDIKDQSFSSIWRRRDYRAFRRNHVNGRGTDSCGNCSKLFCSAHII
jgi:MoaA/NifB/PqqE/SkfB family radical SAM enzyme